MIQFYLRNLLVCLVLLLLGSQLKAADYYWVGGAGSWSQISHWSTTSGGPANHSIIPGPGDNVFFDANSGFGTTTKTVTLDANAFCNNMTWDIGVPAPTNFVGNGTFTVTLGGNLVLVPTVTYSLIYVVFTGGSAATLTSNGTVTGTLNMAINKPGGGLTLTDNLIYNTPSNSRNAINLVSGYFNAPGKTIKAYGFGSNQANTRSLDISNASLEVIGFGYSNTNKTLNAVGSVIKASAIAIDGGTYHIAEVGATENENSAISNTTFRKITFTHPSTGSLARIGSGNTVDTIIFMGSGSIRNSNNVVGYVSFAASGAVGGANNKIHYADVKGAFSIIETGNNVFDTLLTAPNKNLSISGTNTINQYFRAGGTPCDGFTEVTGVSNGTLNFAPGSAFSIDNVMLTNMAATGTGTPITLTGIDNGGNTGFVINEPSSASGTTLYWVGGAGDWNDRNHWSYSSGGAGGACIPFVADNVVFDASSGFTAGNNIVTTSANTYSHNITWAAGVGTTTFNESGSFTMRVYGSLVLQPAVTLNAVLVLQGTEASTLTSNGWNKGGVIFRIERSGTNGGLTLADDLISSTASIALPNGKLLMPNRTVQLGVFSSLSAAARTVDISNSNITVTTWELDARNCTWVNNAAGSFITANTRFVTNGLTYPKVHCGPSGNNVSIGSTTIGELVFTNTGLSPGFYALNGDNTVGTLECKGAAQFRGNNTITNLLLAPSRNYIFANTQTINGLFRYNNPACSGLGEMQGTVGTSATLNFGPSSSLDFNNVYLENMTATGKGVPVTVAGADAGGNTGFTITSGGSGPRYWVGGSGDWNDPAHWSSTSGGAAGSGCVPTANDDVYFDANSGFTTGSRTVTISTGNAYCRNMSWAGAASSPILNKSASFGLEVWGNLVMNPAVTINGRVNFIGPANSTITPNGANLGDFDIIIAKPAGSTINLAGNYSNANTEIELKSGSLNMSGRTVTLRWLTDGDVATASSLNITNTTFNGGWHYRGAARTLQAAGSVLNANIFRSNGHTYNVVNVSAVDDSAISIGNTTIDSLVFTDPSPTSQAQVGGTNTINYLEFKGKGLINGTGNTIGDLIFFPGKQYSFLSGSNNTITGNWYASGTPCNLTEINSSAAGTATVTKTSGAPSFDYIRLRGITAAGTTPFVAGEHTVDLGGNVNWNIAPYNNTATIVGLGPDKLFYSSDFPYTIRTDGFFASPLAQFQWKKGATVVGTGSELVITTPGTYTVNVTYPDGCGTSDQIVITQAASDLSVVNTVNKPAPAIGSEVIFTIVATNNGPQQSTGITVTDLLPAGYTYKSSAPQTGTYDAGTGVWNIGTLANGASSTLTITAVVRASGPYGTTATISGPEVDGVNNNTAAASTTPFAATLSVVKGADATEPATNGSFTISLPAGITISEDITVNYTVGGTATPGTDYTSLPASIVLPAGQNSVTLPVTVINENVIEPTETVVTTLTGGTSTNFTFGLSTTAAATVNVNDDDNTPANRTISVTRLLAAVTEPDDTRFVISLPAGFSAPEDITVNYSMSGTAASGLDYQTLSGTAIIPAGSTSVEAIANSLEDQFIEGQETMIMTLNSASAPTLGNFIVSATSATITINDNDNVAANLVVSAVNSGNAAEPATNGGFSISLPPGFAATSDVTVNYTIGGSATAGVDYQAITGSIKIPAGQNVVLVPVNVIDNTIIEPVETVIMNISGGSDGSNAYAADPGANSATVTITDNDHSTNSNIVLLTKVSDALEGGTNGQYRIALPPGVTSSENVVVTFNMTGTADNADYTLVGLSAGNIVIPAGANEKIIEVDAGNDGIIEGPETAVLNLTSASSANYPFTIDPAGNGAVVNIVDANAASSTPLQVLAGTNATEPAANGSFTVKLAGVATSAWPITVGYSLSGTATQGADYQAIGTITIPANTNSISVPVTVLDDQIIEANTEQLVFTLLSGSATDGGGNAFIFPPDPANNDITLTISDNDAASRVLKVVGSANAAEPSTNGSFAVSLPVGYVSSTDINLVYNMGGLAMQNTDYTINTVLLPAYANSVTIPVNVLDDQLMESDEGVLLDFVSAADANGAYTSAVGGDIATITINDNDNVASNRVLSVSTPVNGTEGGSSGSLTVQLPAGVLASQPVNVTYIISGSATAGADYSTLSGTAQIPTGQNGVAIPITVTNDQIIENSETVTITITGGEAGGFTYTANPDSDSGTINIIDNDNIPANRIVSVETTRDGGEGVADGFRFRIFLPAGISTSEEITVNYTLTGTALRGTDYNLASSVTIAAGDIGNALLGSVINDQIVEGTETVIITLTSAVSNNLTFMINPTGSSATVTITDNDDTPANRTVSITKTTDAAEPATNGTFNISLPAGITVPEDITVTYTVSGTAVAGTDYTALSGSLLIPTNQNNAELTVPVLNDLVFDDLETVIVTLTGGSSANFTFGPHATNGSATLDIIDDEPVPPVITSFAPAGGYAGLQVVITGLRFTGATEVAFNGTPALFTVNSASTITATVSAGTSTGLITVTTPHGTATSATNFTILNVAPVAVPDNLTLTVNTPGSGDVLSNDSDPNGHLLTASLVTAPVHGTIVLNADGSFTYSPNVNYFGPDSFEYQVCDNGTPSLCSSAVVSITVENLPSPQITNITASNVDGTYKVGDLITILATFDQNVTVDITGGLPAIMLGAGVPGRYAEYVSGNGTNTLTFSYTVQEGDQSADLDYTSASALALNGATIRGATNIDAQLELPVAGAPGSLGANKDLVLDGLAPEITSVNVPAAGTYRATQNLDFTINYSEAVTVNTIGGTPRVAITLDNGGTVYASYLSGSGTGAHVYRFTAATGQQDNTGIVLATSLDLNGGTQQDVAGNPASLILNNLPSTSTILVDAVVPVVTSINRADASPTSAAVVTYTIIFSEGVTGVDLTDFTLALTGSATGTLAGITPVNATTYTLTVNNVAGSGTLGADLKASATGIADLAGNAIAAGFTGQLYTIILPAPTDINLSAQTVAENRPAGTQVGLLSSVSADPAGTYTYTLVSGTGSADNASFSISGNQLQAAQLFDFESKSSYSIRIRTTNSHNQTFEKSFSITISDVNESPTLAAVANQEICYTSGIQTLALSGITAGPETAQSVTLSVSSTNANLFDQLTVGPVTNGTSVLSYRLKDGASGTAQVTILVSDNGGTSNGGINTLSRSFTLDVAPALQLSITPSVSTTISKGASIQLTASGAANYTWDNATGIISGQNGPVLTVRPAQTTTYTVSGTTGLCSSTQSVTITVVEDYNLVANNVLTPNGDGKNDFFTVKNIDMYPNNELRIFDRAGKTIYSKRSYNNEWDGTLNGSPLDEDTYYYIIDFGNGVKAQKGFISIVRKY